MSETSLQTELKQPDEFVGFFSKVGAYVVKHSKPLLLILGGALVLAVASVGWYYYAAYKNSVAADKLYAVLKDYPTEVSEGTFTRESWQALLDKLTDFRKQNSGSSLDTTAALYQAGIYMKMGQFVEAETTYKKAQSSLKKPYAYIAAEGEAQSLMEQKKYEAAEKVWKYLAESADNPLQANHVWQWGVSTELKGDKPAAIKILEDFVVKFPTSYLSGRVKSKLAALKSN